MEEGVAGSVIFRAAVTPEGTVSSVDILRVPHPGLGFEEATRRAVMKWRFEPGRADGRAIGAAFVGSAGFFLRPKDEEAIEHWVRRAFETWTRPPELGQVEEVGRIRVRGEAVGPSSVLERRLTESFGPARERASELLVESIQFEGHDAWVSTALRQPRSASPDDRFRTFFVARNDGWYAFLSEDPDPSEDPNPWGIVFHEGASGEFSEPVVRGQPPNPVYPRSAVERRIEGDVILQIAVELDGSTTVLRVVRSLPFCTAAAVESAWKWRWRPGVREGKPTRALGIITVSFDIGK